ncbi:hypothetical protein AB1Y20_013782 [Prymnesium parvum]|uniref:Uncharacterized protein n=1 Tax=Prymnesium parvum TaxID=97485 RepID=A0AB34IGF7_PRYPA
MPSQPSLAVPLSYPEPPSTGAGQSASTAVPSFQSLLVTRAAELTGEPAAAPVQPLANTSRHSLSSPAGDGAAASADKTSAPTCREPVGATPGPSRIPAAVNLSAHLSVAASDKPPRHFGDTTRVASGTTPFQTPSTIAAPTATVAPSPSTTPFQPPHHSPPPIGVGSGSRRR